MKKNRKHNGNNNNNNKKTGRRKTISPIRTQKLLEGRAILDPIPNASILDKIYELFKNSDFSKKEVTMLLYPHEIVRNKDGLEVPTRKAVRKATVMLHEFRIWEENQSMVIWADIVQNLEKKFDYWIIKRIQSIKEYKDIQKRLQSIGNAVLQLDKDSVERLKLDKRTIAKLDRAMEERVRWRIRKKDLRDENHNNKKQQEEYEEEKEDRSSYDEEDDEGETGIE